MLPIAVLFPVILTGCANDSGAQQGSSIDFPARLAQAQGLWMVGGAVLLSLIIVLLYTLFRKTRNEGKRLEALVDERTERLDVVNNHYKGVIWSVNKQRVVTTFKGKYLEVIGVTPSFLEGKNLSAAVMKGQHLDVVESIERTFAEGPQDWISEIGGNIYHSITTPIYDSNGEVTDVVGSTDDVTETVRLQRELEKAAEAAEAASRAKTTFLANMSHEIRSPINAIVGMTTIGASATDAERMKYSFAKIQDASNHLLGLINDILDMSKIEAGKFEISPVEFNFEKMLRQIVDVINYRVEEKHLKLTVTYCKDIPCNLISDKQRISQVIMNLLSNAVKFTQERGSIGLDARCICKDNDGVTIEFTVTDSGIGITPEQMGKLFHTFQQAEDSTARKYGGTGLGLSICKGIVEMMGGRIWAESEYGKGSTFSFVIQAKQGMEIKERLQAPGAEAGGTRALFAEGGIQESPEQRECDGEGAQPGAASDFNGCSVLLVEDVEINREIVQTLLEPTLLEIDCAENGSEAVRLFRDKPEKYDLIFMDVQMPIMDGYEATRHIRSLDVKKAKDIPIIAMTANVFREDVEKCLDAGMSGHIGKPFSLDELLDILQKQLPGKIA